MNIRAWRKREEGDIVVLVALSMSVLMGFTAFAVDFGMLASDKQALQNAADAAALDTLPGIGPAKAAAILEYRKSHGFFRAPEDLMKVPGIKEGTYGKLAERITVGELPEEKTAEEVSREARWPGLLLPERGLSPGDRRESPEAMTAYPGEGS